jgi:PiT family inorganic phosphate transporter
MAFSHGANDAQKVMGVITLALVASGQLTSSEVPTWVIVACALVMGLGTTVGGWRIIRTMGMMMVKLEPVQGFAAETSAAMVLLFTAHFGLPVSMTHTITSSILGVRSTKRLSAVRWGVTGKIFSARKFTFPGAALLGAGAHTLLASFT